MFHHVSLQTITKCFGCIIFNLQMHIAYHLCSTKPSFPFLFSCLHTATMNDTEHGEGTFPTLLISPETTVGYYFVLYGLFLNCNSSGLFKQHYKKRLSFKKYKRCCFLNYIFYSLYCRLSCMIYYSVYVKIISHFFVKYIHIMKLCCIELFSNILYQQEY